MSLDLIIIQALRMLWEQANNRSLMMNLERHILIGKQRISQELTKSQNCYCKDMVTTTL